MDFSNAYISKDTITLYDEENLLISEVPFTSTDDYKSVICIRKDGNTLFFVLQGSVDDESGIMFVNDDSGDFLDGINSIERIGGNFYKYDTQIK